MTRPNIVLAILLATIAAAATAPAQDAPRPNVIVILADDLGSGDLGAYNPDSQIPTPVLDRLAASGMRFTDMHSPSGVCTPTRYGVLTGRYCWRTKMKRGVLGGKSPALIEDGRETVASLLQAAGYRTGAFGEWHLGLGRTSSVAPYASRLTPGPNDVGFHEWWGIPASLDMEPYLYVRNKTVEAEPTEKVKGSKHRRQKGGGFWRGGGVAPGFKHIDVLPRIVDESVKFIDACAQNKDQPFFMYVPFSAPHTPWLPTKAHDGTSLAGYYGDFVHQVDSSVGAILTALDRHELTDDTLVIVTSDNGSHWPVGDIARWGHAANLHYRGQKADIHEGGHRVPFIARWPGKIAAGAVQNELGCLTDILRTTCTIVGVTVPEGAGEDSFDLSPALLGRRYDGPLHETVIHHSAQGMFAVRQGKWKLIEDLGSGGFTAPRRIPKDRRGKLWPAGQLFDLENDPSELRNLWQARPRTVERMKALLADVRQGD